MSRLSITTPSRAELVLDELYEAVARRMTSGTTLLCPVDMAAAFVRMCHAQSCGKCVPCRIGLGQLGKFLEKVLRGEGDDRTLHLIESTAKAIADSADCAIGFEAAELVLRGLEGFREDYESHIKSGRCNIECTQGVPCMSHCPAGVEIPDYIALVAEGRYDDAIRIIRKDNPFPCVCGYVCEHPCEAKCRRRIVDDSVNIRGLKRFAADNADLVDPPAAYEQTGKRVAIIGAGPAGLTAAYYLTLMGHTVEVFEKRDALGGMLRYGIPRYRLPAEKLDWDIEAILKTGIKVHTNVEIGRDRGVRSLRRDFDAVYIAIGAHTDKKLDIPGVEGPDVVPAIEMLRGMGSGDIRDFTGKKVTVVGGGNVAMDAARSAVRCGAERVNLVYRRRRQDMTALPIEVDGAVAEGVELITLMAPDSVERDENGKIVAFIAKPQLSGKLDVSGRPAPMDAFGEKRRIPTDIVIVAIGQAIDSDEFGRESIPLDHSAICAGGDTAVYERDGVFAGGDCVTGPATVIRAIAAGKVAAANIDNYLGFHHTIKPDVQAPPAHIVDATPWGRANMTEREANERKGDFLPVECPLDCQSATREALRCLRCDHYGYGPYFEDRRRKW